MSLLRRISGQLPVLYGYLGVTHFDGDMPTEPSFQDRPTNIPGAGVVTMVHSDIFDPVAVTIEFHDSPPELSPGAQVERFEFTQRDLGLYRFLDEDDEFSKFELPWGTGPCWVAVTQSAGALGAEPPVPESVVFQLWPDPGRS